MTNLRAGKYAAAREQAARSLEIFEQLQQPLSSTGVYATLSAAQLGLGNYAAAQAAAEAALSILDDCMGEGPDFPHRDYWFCAHTFAALGNVQGAQHAEREAVTLLLRRAERISDPVLRHSYMTKVAVHAEIIAAVAA